MWLLDIIVVLGGFSLAYGLREFALPLPSIQPLSFYSSFIIASVVAFVFSFTFFGVYDRKRVLLSLSYLVDFLKGLFLWGAFVVAFSYFTRTDYSRAVVIMFFASASGFAYISRFFLAWRLSRATKENGDTEIKNTISEMVRLSRVSSDELSLLEGLRVRRIPGAFYFITKRIIDIVFAIIGLLFTVLLFPLISFFIRKDSPGKTLIKQDRIGLNGKKFVIYKFRTMKIETPLYEQSPRDSGDSRITKAGRALRKYSIDEFPQFWNVLKGDMSVVGPRPEMPFVAERYNEWQKIRLTVKPGITGAWQILGRKDIPLEENLEYDIYYVFHQSLFLDLAIILKTVPHLLFPRGAY